VAAQKRNMPRTRHQMVEATPSSGDNQRLLETLTNDLEDLSTYISDLMSTIPHPIYTVNPSGIIIDANNALERLTGRSLEELLGEKPNIIFADEQALEEINHETREQGFVKEKELSLLTCDGKEIPVLIYTQARGDGLDNMSYVATLINISKRKKAEEEAKQSAERLISAMEDTIEAMAMIVEMRDPYTAGHQRRVASLSRAIAREMNYSEDQLRALHLAALIHDIGKVRVPAEILTNPDGLTEAEFSMIKMHPLIGYEILKTIELPWPIAQIVYQHHERMNGSGYPKGLSGEDIIMEARILAVADVVEAISSHRPYRAAYSIDKALDEIWKHRGTLYDTNVVQTCLELFRENKFSFKPETQAVS